MPNMTLDQALAGLPHEPSGSHFAPVRIAVHGEDGLVRYASGGLVCDQSLCRMCT